jgi:hypothetical protein
LNHFWPISSVPPGRREIFVTLHHKGGIPMNTAYSPFSLHEYASGMLNVKVTVTEDDRASTASDNLKTRMITIPAIDYSKPIDESYYRLVKGWIDHGPHISSLLQISIMTVSPAFHVTCAISSTS